MIHFCVMGGHEGRLSNERKVYFTLFGGCELTRPTLARQLAWQRQRSDRGRYDPPKLFFLTICGGVEVRSPTLAEEFIDLRELIRSGALSNSDFERCLADFARCEVVMSSFTLMGGFSENTLPSEDQEAESLALHQYLGNIPDSAVNVLKFGVGQRDAERRATIRRAVQMAG